MAERKSKREKGSELSFRWEEFLEATTRASERGKEDRRKEDWGPIDELPVNQIIKENIALVLMFSFSYKPLKDLFKKNKEGEWQYLKRANDVASLAHAQRAIIEIAMMVRLLDEKKLLMEYLKNGKYSCGVVQGGTEDGDALTMKQTASKIIHSQKLEWILTSDKPHLVCLSNEPERWVSAAIDIQRFALAASHLAR